MGKGLLPCKHDSIFCNFLLITYYIILDEVLVPDYNHFYRLLFYHTPIYFEPLGLWEFVGHCTVQKIKNYTNRKLEDITYILHKLNLRVPKFYT